MRGDIAPDKRKKAFAKNSWDIISASQKLLKKRLRRALESENEMYIILDMLKSASDEIDSDEKTRILKNIAALKLEDAGKLSSVISSMFDKASLAEGNPTVNLHGDIETAVKKFEDL